MRIGVMSDSHGNMRAVIEAVAKMGHVDLYLHAGDHYQDALVLAQHVSVPVVGVGGNCDLMMSTPRQHIGEYEGHKLLLIHGHQYNVKSGTSKILAHARQKKLDIVVFGHTHVPMQQQLDGVFLFNPGSVAYPRMRGHPTYGILTLVKSQVDFSIQSL